MNSDVKSSSDDIPAPDPGRAEATKSQYRRSTRPKTSPTFAVLFESLLNKHFEFNKPDLTEHKIEFSKGTPSATSLAQEGFGAYPFELAAKTIPLCDELFPLASDYAAIREMINERAANGPINVEWCRPRDALEIQTNASTFKDELSMSRVDALNRFVADWSVSSIDCRCPIGMFLGRLFSGVTSKKLMRHAMYEVPLKLEVKPDLAFGPFEVDDNKVVVSHIDAPVLHQTAQFLQKIVNISDSLLGFSNLLLPLVVAEVRNEEPRDKEPDACKLFIEMAMIRSMMELVWSKPPEFNFGFYVTDNKWRVFIMRRDEKTGVLKVRVIFYHVVHHLLDLLYVGTYCCRLAAYINEQLKAVELVSEQRQEEILDEMRRKLNNRKTDVSINVKRSLVMRQANEDIYCTIYNGRRAVVKMGSREAIKRELAYLRRTQGPGFAEVLDFGLLNNNTFCLVLPA